MTVRIDQSKASARGDVVAGNKSENNYYYTARSVGRLENLVEKLKSEVKDNKHFQNTIEGLQYFYVRKSADGVDGLEEKLKRSCREDQIQSALDKKEFFSKRLEKLIFYESAQEMFAYLLAKVDYGFDTFIVPRLGDATVVEINEIVDVKIVEPIVSECGEAGTDITHLHVMGMIYWLADNCFVRWHK